MIDIGLGDTLESELAQYIAVLSESAGGTRRAEDRRLYEAHLAQAAVMFKVLRRDRSLSGLRALIATERRNYGWSYLSDDQGHSAESAFDRFATAVEQQCPAVQR